MNFGRVPSPSPTAPPHPWPWPGRGTGRFEAWSPTISTSSGPTRYVYGTGQQVGEEYGKNLMKHGDAVIGM